MLPLLTCLACMHFTVSGVCSICSNPDLFFSVALPEALFILKPKIFWPSFDLQKAQILMISDNFFDVSIRLSRQKLSDQSWWSVQVPKDEPNVRQFMNLAQISCYESYVSVPTGWLLNTSSQQINLNILRIVTALVRAIFMT